MIEKIKISMKLLRYTYGKKMAIAMTIPLGLIGLLPLLNPELGITSIFCLLIIGMWPVQLLFSLSASGLVLSSKRKKELQIAGPVLLSFGSMVLLYSICLLILAPRMIRADGMELQKISFEIIAYALEAVVIMIYCGAAYKFMTVSCICFFGAYIVLLTGYRIGIRYWQTNIPLWAAIMIGFVLLALGGIAQYGISKLLYKRPVDKRAQVRTLQKYL